jgi:glucose/arabinose dehydrogenase
VKLLISLFLFFGLQNCDPSKQPNSVAQTELKDKVLVRDLSFPWEILWGPDNFIWMTERGGKISRVNPSDGSLTLIHTISEVVSRGEGGLLGMALHPQFNTNPYVYVAYNFEGATGYMEKIVRFTYNGSTLTSPMTIINNIEASGIHNGARLLVLNDKLYITTGDASEQQLAQNTSSLNGKTLRVNLDGSIPSDNPIPGNPAWSWGHRNAQGLVFTGRNLVVSEHGPDSDDEINIIEKGRNYGWPAVKGLCNTESERVFCASQNVKEPIYTWTPTAAVCGTEYYGHDLIPSWKNSLLVTALKNSRLYIMKLNNDHSAVTEVREYLNGTYGRMRDVCIAPNGKVYICTSNGRDDKIIEVSN